MLVSVAFRGKVRLVDGRPPVSDYVAVVDFASESICRNLRQVMFKSPVYEYPSQTIKFGHQWGGDDGLPLAWAWSCTKHSLMAGFDRLHECPRTWPWKFSYLWYTFYLDVTSLVSSALRGRREGALCNNDVSLTWENKRRTEWGKMSTQSLFVVLEHLPSHFHLQ